MYYEDRFNSFLYVRVYSWVAKNAKKCDSGSTEDFLRFSCNSRRNVSLLLVVELGINDSLEVDHSFYNQEETA